MLLLVFTKLDLVISGNPEAVTQTVAPSVNYLSAPAPKHYYVLNALHCVQQDILVFVNT